jgi:hypothetical protein
MKEKKILRNILLLIFVTENILFVFYSVRIHVFDNGQTDINTIKQNDIEVTEKVGKSNEEKAEKNDENDANSSDTQYKIFFGQWEVTKVVYARPGMNLEKAEAYIGMKISFTRDAIKIEGQNEILKPQYSIAIIPIFNLKDSYVNKMPTLGDIGINGEYFVYVYISTDNLIEKFHVPGNEFYIKDDDTLIALFEDMYYEIKRISYIEDAEIYKKHI